MKKKIVIVLILITLINLYPIYANDTLKITSTSAILMEQSTKRILYGKNERKKVKIASTTKILTAIVAIENCSLDEVVTVSKNAASVGGSRVGISKGDEIKLESLMYGMLLKSGNDCAVAIAEHVAGSVDKFVLMMNKKAYEIGAKDTICSNPHGLDTEQNCSTAYDLAKIMSYAKQNEDLAKIMSTTRTTKYFGKVSKYLANTNKLLTTYKYCDGGKTGFTNGANRCLVASAKKDDLELIVVILGADTTNIRFLEARKLLDYGIENYKMEDVKDSVNWYIDIPVIKGNILSYTKKIEMTHKLPLKENEKEDIYLCQNIIPKIDAPMKKGTYLGNIELMINNERLYTKRIYLEEDIVHNTVLDYIILGINELMKFNIEF